MNDLGEFIMEFLAGVRRRLRDRKGQTLVEYALLLVLIALLVYFMLRGTGLQINSTFSTINSQLVNP